MNGKQSAIHASKDVHLKRLAPAIRSHRNSTEEQLESHANIDTSVTSATRWQICSMTAALLLVVGFAVPSPALAENESASDFFVRKVMVVPQSQYVAQRSSTESLDHETAADQFVETVLKGNTKTHRIEHSGDSEVSKVETWRDPDLSFIYGSAPR